VNSKIIPVPQSLIIMVGGGGWNKGSHTFDHGTRWRRVESVSVKVFTLFIPTEPIGYEAWWNPELPWMWW